MHPSPAPTLWRLPVPNLPLTPHPPTPHLHPVQQALDPAALAAREAAREAARLEAAGASPLGFCVKMMLVGFAGEGTGVAGQEVVVISS